jgi:hypothetical protein
MELTNFPASAPTATPWDLSTGAALEPSLRPRGGRADTVFRRDNWNNGTALYAPWDRVALSGHPNWVHESPLLAWNQDRNLIFFLERVHELVNCDAYQGI